MGDDLAGSRRPRVEMVTGDAWLKADGRRVQFAEQPSRCAQGHVGPGIGRKPVPVPRLPARVGGDVAVDEGQDFPAAFDPQQPSSAVETGCLQMPQVLVHGGRPWPHRPQQPVTAPRHAAGHPPAGDQNLARPRLVVAGHQTSIVSTDAYQPPLPKGWPAFRSSARSRRCRQTHADQPILYTTSNAESSTTGHAVRRFARPGSHVRCR